MSKLQLDHKLKNRHLQMIALGGVIGTGLFFGSAKSIQLTGPSIVLSYLLGGIVIYIIMRALGEMTVDHPTSGSFSEYAHTYMGTYAGFISGWSAWFEYTVVCMAELTAVTVFFDYFIPGIPHWMLCAAVLAFFTVINLISVKTFGEFEFWFAGIKILAIILMLIFAAYLIIFRGGVNTEIHQYSDLNMFFAGGLKGFAISLVIVVFAFGGSEFISIAAGEAENPQRNVPLAINGTIFRILIFYVFTMLVIILLYPYQKLNSNVSPFVDVFKLMGFKAAAGAMNIVAITAALSSFNSCLYAGSRMLYNLSSNGFAPKGLSLIKNHHVPRAATLATSSSIAVAVIVNYIFPEKAIMYLMTVTTGAILIVWFMVLVTQIYFRQKKNKEKKELSYKLILYPFTNIFALVFLLMVLGIMTQMDDMKMCVYITPLWILALSFIYFIRKNSIREKSLNKQYGT